MRKLRYYYKMQMLFELPANDHHFTLRCFPSSDGWQKICCEKVQIYPNYFICNQTDSFSNRCVYGKALLPHNYFAVETSGVAEVSGVNPLALNDGMEAVFKYPTKLTQCGGALSAFYEKLMEDPCMPGNSARSPMFRALPVFLPPPKRLSASARESARIMHTSCLPCAGKTECRASMLRA